MWGNCGARVRVPSRQGVPEGGTIASGIPASERALPTGLVTFFLTDVEGSVKLWEGHRDEMAAAVAMHEQIIAAAAQRHGGILLKSRGEGDATFCVFDRPAGATAAALEIQRSLDAEPLVGGAPLRVRIAIHTGEAELREGDYFGPVVNRVARLRGTAHGCQILLTESAAGLAGDFLPMGAFLRSLGTHRLRDLMRAEEVFQLCHPDLPAEFPPLRSLEAVRHNLPEQLTSFVGREEDLVRLREVMERARVVTLTGFGGAGKTRLSIQAAAESAEENPDGVWLIELAPLTDPSVLAQTVASVLGLREEPGRSIRDTLSDHLKDARALLVLDNCEHLIAASADLVQTLVTRCARLRVLATSREPLGIGGEAVVALAPLPAPSDRVSSVADATAFPSVHLFVDRAVAALPSFELTDQNAAAVARICAQLDGIPLAIELAAARIKVLSVDQIADRLRDRFRLLAGGARTALPRQRTLRAAIDWSYDLLGEQERRLFARVAAFSGGFSLEAAERVGADELLDELEILDVLSQLVDRSLVVADPRSEGTRYLMLQTVLEYAGEKLSASGEDEALRERHLGWCAALVEEAAPQLAGAEQGAWLDRLSREHDNVRAAMTWAMGTDPWVSLRIASDLTRFWEVRGFLAEGRGWLESSLEAVAGEAASEDRAVGLTRLGAIILLQGELGGARSILELALVEARATDSATSEADTLDLLGLVSWRAGDLDTAGMRYEEALGVGRRLGSAPVMQHALMHLGMLASDRGDLEKARAHYAESLAIAQQRGDLLNVAVLLNSSGIAAREQGDFAGARALYEEALQISRDLGHRYFEGGVLVNLGEVHEEEGDLDEATNLYELSAAIERELGQDTVVAACLHGLASIARRKGDPSNARTHLREALDIVRGAGDMQEVARCLESFALVAAAEGRWDDGVLLLGGAARVREEIGAPIPPSARAELDAFERDARERLGDAAFQDRIAEGRAAGIDSVVESLLK